MVQFEQALLRLKERVGVQSDKQLAALLGMSPTAFSDRKKRNAFPEEKLRALVQQRPELGIDVDYVLHGAAKDRFGAFPPTDVFSFGAVLDRMYQCSPEPGGFAGPEGLGIDAKEFAQWRKRGEFPLFFLGEFAREHGVSVRWLMTGVESPPVPDESRPVARQREEVYRVPGEPALDPVLRAAIEMVGDELRAQGQIVSGARLYELVLAAQRYIRHGRELQRRQAAAEVQGGKREEKDATKTKSKTKARSS